MSKASFLPPEELRSGTILLQPRDILIDPVTRVRTVNRTIEEKAGFAALLAREGQSTPILVRPPISGDSHYRLIAGEARLSACAANNVPVVAYIRDVDDATARRLSFSENYRRKQFSPVDLAALFLKSRGTDYDADWSRIVAEEYGVSRATVTEHVKMYEALADSPDILEQVKTGALRMDAAVELAKTAAEDRRAQLQKAAEIASAQVKASSQTARRTRSTGQPEAKAPGASERAPVQARHIREAKRQSGQSVDRALTRAELLEGLGGLIMPAYPAVMNAFLIYLTTTWQSGNGTKPVLEQHWRSIAASLDNEKPGRRRPKSKTAKR